MTPWEAFMATQTEVLRQILQTQQQITQQMNRGPPHGANHEGPNQVTTYTQFIGMKPPTFSKAEDPLEAEAWIKAIEAKFSAFVMPCSEENKANFAALQLRGDALMWWDHFKSMQRGCAVTWDDFNQPFKSHHIPKVLMDRKMRELLVLKQGFDTVYRYAQKFNSQLLTPKIGKRLTCGPSLVEKAPFGKRFSSKHSVKASAVESMSSLGRRAVSRLEEEAFGNA
jgi:hypothetical protein